MRLKFSLLCLIITFALFGIISTLKIYAAPSSGILVNVVPSNPAPRENTNITLKSYENNLDSVLIIWSVDGKKVSSGIGKKSFSVNAPDAGSETTVVATISLPEGAIETKIIVKPVVMVLLWQANDSYVPPFYKGKALPAPDSEVKVVAMPEVKSNILPQNMTYYWKKDYTNNVDGSGYGKNFFLYTNDYLENSNNISVTASTIDQKYSFDANINIGMIEPKILFYKNDDRLGTIWQNSLVDRHKIQGGEVVEAVPYFISPKEIQNPTLIWSWFINDSLINLASFRKNLIPLSVETGTHGTSRLRLDIENQDKIFQTTSKEIDIEF
ncbi:MAG: hypothetical protein US33_C0003G0006 [Parcubacteria group bacterium GW2011_GWC1_36_9]|uniref:Uncharacterized protein n=1 Tax=Candidatus Yanofskybacteria bacterium GW2011_GWC2_37_9 TaxID=1619028 RepID=A0A0G0KDI0_9BACT|nr:MAG: hypothetical protein US33_C0003G0006 [Parcubacteria group bacterium GW2011_GWC1_36_9]KKQ47199.1 MAG: hypothetical protein US65_C0014G0011 [Candidatus Yanofskybacteria bacterium GW2011_GWC2_37_9]